MLGAEARKRERADGGDRSRRTAHGAFFGLWAVWAVGWAATCSSSLQGSQWAGGGLEAIAAVDGSGAREIGTGSVGVFCSLHLSSAVFDSGVVKPASSPELRPACAMLVLGYGGTWHPTCGVVGCWWVVGGLLCASTFSGDVRDLPPSPGRLGPLGTPPAKPTSFQAWSLPDSWRKPPGQLVRAH